MPLIYITGAPGSGKTTVLQNLRNLGYEAYGTDEHGFSHWVSRQTGAVVIPPQQFDINAWSQAHEWVFNTEAIAALKDQSDQTYPVSTTYLCGIAGSAGAVWRYFDRVIVLTVKEEVLGQRVLTRTNNRFGKTPGELKIALEWQDKHVKGYRDHGARIIDTTKMTPEEVVAAILHIR